MAKGQQKGKDKKDKSSQKGKKKPTQLWTLYEVQGDKLIRKNPFSPKSPGDFMAKHKGRLVCGKTGYTEYSQEK